MLTHIKNKNVPEFYTSERCYVVELLNDEKHPEISTARCRVEPGVTTQLHRLSGVKEIYSIENGHGEMDDGNKQSFSVKPGDNIIIQPNEPQRITNSGNSDLIFVVTCSPRFTPDCYVNLEE